VSANAPDEDPRRSSFLSSLLYVFGFFFAIAALAWLGACLLRNIH
jgi:hypothetical protein